MLLRLSEPVTCDVQRDLARSSTHSAQDRW